jgi:hypothetical protein
MKYNKNEIIGRMRDRITIQNVTRSKSDTGYASESWADLTTVWANAESKLPPSNETVIDGNNTAQDERIYNDPLYQPVPEVPYGFDVGSYVYAMQNGNNFYTRAIVLSISGDNYTIQFDNGVIQTTNLYDLKIYFPCNCGTTINGVTYSSGEFITIGLQDQVQCTFPVSLLT